MHRTRRSLRAGMIAFALLAGTACTDRLVGFTAGYASNMIAVRSAPPRGAELRFTVPKAIRTSAGETVQFVPDGVIMHLPGYLPMKAEAVEDAGDGYGIRMTLPPDLVELTGGILPAPVHVTGDLYLPGRRSSSTPRAGEELESATAWTVGVALDAEYTGPMTRIQQRLSGFFRGLYSAR